MQLFELVSNGSSYRLVRRRGTGCSGRRMQPRPLLARPRDKPPCNASDEAVWKTRAKGNGVPRRSGEAISPAIVRPFRRTLRREEKKETPLKGSEAGEFHRAVIGVGLVSLFLITGTHACTSVLRFFHTAPPSPPSTGTIRIYRLSG